MIGSPKSQADDWVDTETQLADRPDHQTELRLWLRLLACTNLVQTDVRRRLRDEFDFTLPRFDLLAQLDKAEDGLVLGEVSRRLMVSAGNVTALVERLLDSGHITREQSPTDRRVQIIRMTPIGRSMFHKMAERHGSWISELFSGLLPGEVDELMEGLRKMKTSLRAGMRGSSPV